jgi:hypothetical protein
MPESPDQLYRRNWDLAFGSSDDAGEKAKAADSSQDQASHEAQSTPSAPIPELHLDRIKYETRMLDKNKSKPGAWLKFGVQVGAFVAAVIYAGIAAHQAKIMNETLSEARKQSKAAIRSADNSENFFRADERAWVEIGNIKIERIAPPDPALGLSSEFSYHLYPENVGKTVAREVRININFSREIGREFNNNKQAIEKEQVRRDERGSYGPPGPHAIVPGATSSVPFEGDGFAPSLDPSTGKAQISFILGKIDYWDTFNTHHWVRFCYLVSDGSGNLRHCKYGNDEDSNPEPLSK